MQAAHETPQLTTINVLMKAQNKSGAQAVAAQEAVALK